MTGVQTCALPISAQAAGKKLVEEAEKQAQKLKDEAEKLIEKQYGGSE